MLRKATMLLGTLLLLAPAITVYAQTEPTVVTIRQLNAIPDENVSVLTQTGADLASDQIDTLIFNDLIGEQVKFTAVVLSDPLNSGLASPRDDGNVGRVHIFVRDTSAVSQGVSGMGMQVVPGYPSYVEQGALNLQIGDVIDVVGEASPFAPTMQFAPQTITVIGNVNGGGAFARYAPLVEPIELGTDEVNRVIGEEQIQVNWDSLESIRGQRVRIENATVVFRTVNNTGRPNWAISTDGGNTYVPIYDVSLRYRNDRAGYPDPFQPRDSDNPFVPPPPGSVVNLTGFIVYNGFDPVGRSIPEGALLSIVPFSDDDLEIVESPPITANLSRPDAVPGADDAVEITVDVTPDPERALSSVVLKYFTSDSDDTLEVSPTSMSGTTYTFTIPALADGAFVTYYIEATDDEGGVSEPLFQYYRVLAEGINAIEDVQLVPAGDEEYSPFVGIETDMDITATVQSNPGESGEVTIQDDAELGAWTGIFITGTGTDTLETGDVIHVTHATVRENFGVTQLEDVTFTAESEGGEPYGYKEVTTDVLQDPEIAEAHEGMLVVFNDVQITEEDAGFGEWAFASAGMLDDEVLADDQSDAIEEDFAVTTFDNGDLVEYIRGIWWFSFSNYKLLPETAADIGEVTDTPVEEEELPGRYVLDQNYPNPFNPSTTIQFEVARAGHVRLEVFDLLGRHVTTLVDGQVAAGVQTVTFNAHDLASGMYLYRLSAGAEVLTRTMVLLK